VVHGLDPAWLEEATRYSILLIHRSNGAPTARQGDQPAQLLRFWCGRLYSRAPSEYG
jgi:hypothetical protein